MERNDANKESGGPAFKDQHREAVPPWDNNRTPPLFKTQIQGSRGSQGEMNPPPNDLPMVQAFAVDTTFDEPQPNILPSNKPTDTSVVKISKRTLYWLLGILGIFILLAAVIGGFCISGKCNSNNSDGTSLAISAPSLRPVANPLPSRGVNPIASPITQSSAQPANGPVSAPVPTAAQCSDFTECPLRTCARESLATPNLVCCPTGKYEFLPAAAYEQICTGQLTGAACAGSDTLCQSGTCFQGLCQEDRQASGQPCDSNADCVGTCIGGTCSEGLQPAGASCDEDIDCANSVCALETALLSAKTICCPTGSYEFLLGSINDQVCTGQLAGAACAGSDTLCQSGSCFQGLCQEDKQAQGQPCDSNEDCVGRCIGGTCSEGLQPAGESCDEDSDCANTVCALDTALSSAKTICCPTGSYEFLLGSIYDQVCTGQLAGAACAGSDTLCQSGICIQGLCQEARQANGQLCDSNEDCVGTCIGGTCAEGLQPSNGACDDDSDCSNGVCALATTSSNGFVCCPSGRAGFDFTRSAIVCTK